MKALIILAAVLLVMFLLGQIRVGGRAEYSVSGACVWIRLGGFYLRVYPTKPKPDKPKKKKKAAPERAKKPQSGTLEKIGGALDYAQALLPVLLDAAGSCYQKLRIDLLELELTAGSSDPADAALMYGQANAALGALWHPLTQAFHVKDGTARVKLDFNAPGTTLYANAVLSFKIGQLLQLGIYFGLKALRAFLAVRKKQNAEQQRRKAV